MKIAEIFNLQSGGEDRMKELIMITESEEGEKLVSARELFEFLGSKRDFTTWIKDRIDKYGFVENEDFTLHKFVEGKTWKHDYISLS